MVVGNVMEMLGSSTRTATRASPLPKLPVAMKPDGHVTVDGERPVAVDGANVTEPAMA